ncbi:immunoglobulin-binding protein 1 [Contarinia nasturtii]|uniref:immunoglobulin-binding protein 1 n=1 Tax=Contarinia nasturtii TaxID=265458 RepID=UPI0012D41CE7|nr:immunoglobulin-binding protein 1 [Contarinia nasturtii]
MSETTMDRKLSEIFDEAFDLYNFLSGNYLQSFEICNIPTNSQEFQENVKKCIKLFEDSTRLVSVCGLFSTNELYTELPTSDLKYLLLPFFLGILTQKICGGSRSDIVEVAEVYFKDFLKRCSEYGIYDDVKPIGGGSSGETNSSSSITTQQVLTQQVLQRNQKLEKYRQRKELEDKIKQLKIVMKSQQVDDDIKRDFYINLLKMSTHDAQEELASLVQEKQMLSFQQNRQQMDKDVQHMHKTSSVRPLKPIIITRDLAQKAVYGMGYPSLPTMTVSEFYDERVREGIFPDPSKASNNSNSLQSRYMQEQSNDFEEPEDIEREKKLEEDDEYEIARLRAKDEYKDEHRRGEGNRYNRS